MTRKNTAYWLTTGLVAFVLSAGGTVDLGIGTGLIDMQMLGFPTYFWGILGTWKLLAVAALLAPGLPLIKEWAYAGVFFTVSGAIASHIFYGEPIASAAVPAGVLVLAVASWWLRPTSRRLVATMPLPESRPSALASAA